MPFVPTFTRQVASQTLTVNLEKGFIISKAPHDIMPPLHLCIILSWALISLTKSGMTYHKLPSTLKSSSQVELKVVIELEFQNVV